MKQLFFLFILLPILHVHSQTIDSKFNSAFKKFSADPAFTHATIGLYVVNSNTGKEITSENIQVGMAPASCQKVITASAAFELLGEDFRYATSLGYTGNINNGILDGDIIIKGEGDPTLGSWRYETTAEEKMISLFQKQVSQAGINELRGNVVADESAWQGEVTPDGWIWQDIGSYYGAGARAINWHENQYDLLLKSGKKIGDSVTIVGTDPSPVIRLNLHSLATSAARGTGDNAYIYFPIDKDYGYVRGTIPVNENSFSISGAMPHPGMQLALTLEAALKNKAIENNEQQNNEDSIENPVHTFYTYQSPSLDSIVYWFLKRSVNLYGEALLKTLANKFTQSGSVDSGVAVIQRFWKQKNIETSALHIIDGSGLSPGNRITPASLVTIMQYARKQKWFPAFFDALPEINGIKMKSGSIGGVVSYTGFIKSKSGENYTFSFIINNFDGETNAIRKKMWRLLDILK
ncbi:MAG: D-alanyl-D-alanine carboxypeptidase/D-alanyl-D-alanine-endopeptidase [Ginsengibacter sp.]